MSPGFELADNEHIEAASAANIAVILFNIAV